MKNKNIKDPDKYLKDLRSGELDLTSGKKLIVEEMFAFLATDLEGHEGVIAYGSMPLVGADMERVESIKPLAKLCGEQTKLKIELVKFTKRTHLENIN